MKKLLRKSWFTGILIMGLLLAVFFINLWIMTLAIPWPFEGENFLSLQFNQLDEGPTYIFAYILMLLFYVSVIPVILSGLSLFRKNNWGIVIAGLVFLGLDIALIVFQSLYDYLPLTGAILVIVNVVLILGVFTLSIFRSKAIRYNEKINITSKNNNQSNAKIPIFVLLVNVLTIVIFLTTFIIPLYTWVRPGIDYDAILINSLLVGDSNDIVIIYFFVNTILFIGVFLYFAETLSNYIINKEKFMHQSRKLVKSAFVLTSLFFLAGLAVDIIYTIKWGMDITTISYIPMLFMFISIFSNSILSGKFKGYTEKNTNKTKSKQSNIEVLFYVILLTAATVSSLLIPIIKIDITSGVYIHNIELTGYEIIRDYASLDVGYRIAAYLLVVMLLSVGFCLVVSLTSYLSKSKKFISLVKFTTIINILFTFVIGISGYYFQIAREINKAIVVDLAEFYGYTITNVSSLEYVVGTDAFYALVGSVLVIIIMFIRKVFDRDESSISEGDLLHAGLSESTKVENEITSDFDPCYSFTELDSKLDGFDLELKNRKKLKTNEATLAGLVNFVVEYAKNSRLHLSYTPEDIATFVAGLGASKLSILQGMSGTGKTSLPKIFSEAIYGNCDIVEVESSWKDKNELLGYYNEFSLKYTPKKFTLALYKAALNQEVFTFILLDEMNLSRIEYYFSDFLSLMENEENQREIKLVNIKLTRKEEEVDYDYLALESGHTLKIPSNVWFIGTANRDESTFVISDKVYDRAHTMNFTKRAPKVRNYKEPIDKQYYDYNTMDELFKAAKSNGNFDAESSELIKSIETLLAPYNISFGNRILKQIEDFVNVYKECFVNEDVEGEAIEKILLSKVVAKLEVKTIEDKEKLEMDFVKLNLHQCAEFIKHLDED